jgi:murein L,D-transpeptidase YafK
MKLALYLLMCKIFIAGHFGIIANNPIPSSLRSRQAIERVKPDLEAAIDAKDLKWGSAIFIRIFKKEKQLEVWLQNGDSFLLFRTYKICTYGAGGLGPK